MIITELDKEMENEIFITNIIKTNITNYEKFFYFHTNYSSVKIKHIDGYENDSDDDWDDKEEEEIINKKYILISYPYSIKSSVIMNINEFFLRITIKQLIFEIFDLYYKIKRLIVKLHNIGISHNNISFNNIIINIEKNQIILRNFTESSIIDDNNKDKLYNNNNNDYEKLNDIFVRLIKSINDIFEGVFPLQLFLKTLFFINNEPDSYVNETRDTFIYDELFIQKLNDFINNVGVNNINKMNEITIIDDYMFR